MAHTLLKTSWHILTTMARLLVIELCLWSQQVIHDYKDIMIGDGCHYSIDASCRYIYA